MQGEALQFNSTSDRPRSPGFQLIANGRLMAGALAAKVRSSSYFAADHFEITLALENDGSFWSSEFSVDVDIRFRTNTSSAYVSVVQGRVDSLRIDPVMRLVTIEGRDYAAELIDSVISETFTNQTAAEIATNLARRHNLSPVVDPTTNIIGRYYQDEHDSLSLDAFCGHASEWDLLSYLAQNEGYDLYVSGTSLNFRAAAGIGTPGVVLGPDDVIELQMDRMLTLAGGVEVAVKTWNSREHSADIRTASRNQDSGVGIASSPQVGLRRYVLIRPNLTSEAAQLLAQHKLADLCAQDRTIEFVMPGELLLSPRSIIVLSGTDTQFDRSYRIDQIDRRFSPSGGFLQRVRATGIPGFAPGS